MESQVSLALAVKLAKIFESETSYLSFPLGMGFSHRYLGFMKEPEVSGLSLQEQLNNKADFARLLNIVPSDSPAFTGDASRLLWQRLVRVLEEATFPTSGLTAREADALATAIDFLTDKVTLTDGMEVAVNSAALNRYYAYKTLRDQAEAAYLDEKITVELSTGPEGEVLRRRWAEYRERQLLDARDVAENDWNNLGFRHQVQAAQRTRADLEPKRDLSMYRTAYLSDIELSQLSDINALGLETCATFFSPLDAFEPTASWNRVTLTRAEMSALLAQAPANLRQIFGAGETHGDFESVSFEYSNVAVIRPWFRQDFFASRTWNVADALRVSDGGQPRHGEIPAYITSMLVARNVVVRRRRTQASAPLILPIMSKTALHALRLEAVTPAARLASVGVVLERPVEPAKKPVLQAAALRVAKPASLTSAQPLIAKRVATPALEAARPVALKGAVAKTVAANKLLLQREFSDAKYAGTTIKTPPTAPAPPVEPAPPDVVEERYSFDGVTVLAWVCKRVPRCPDPDPGLAW